MISSGRVVGRVSAGRVARRVSCAVIESLGKSLGKSLGESLEEMLPMSNLRIVISIMSVIYLYLTAAMLSKVHPELDPLGIDLCNCTICRGTKG
jgi:hypothetical protein